jgi:FKBP-type peptidyl-prolyl cis-trans isomerase
MQQKESQLIVPIALAAAFLMFGCVLETVDKDGNVITPTPTDNSVVSTDVQGVSSQSDQLNTEDTVVGTGAEAKSGDTVSVHYVGTLLDGTKFDSSVDRGQPFEFTIGQNSVIQGWEQGIPGMKVGGKRTLTIPPSLGYGEQVAGSIPANSTLIFEVELLGIK